jgi:hypothetical protein
MTLEALLDLVLSPTSKASAGVAGDSTPRLPDPDAWTNLAKLTALKTLSLKSLNPTYVLPLSLTALAVQECYSLQPCIHLPNLQRLVLRGVFDSNDGKHTTKQLPLLTALQDPDMSCEPRDSTYNLGISGHMPLLRYVSIGSCRLHVLCRRLLMAHH